MSVPFRTMRERLCASRRRRHWSSNLYPRPRFFRDFIAARNKPEEMSAKKTPAPTDSRADRWNAQSRSKRDVTTHNTPLGRRDITKPPIRS